MSIDIEERELLESINNDEWSSVEDVDAFKKHLRETAENTMRKDHRMNIRIAKSDLDSLKAKALEEGIPYQTFVTSILHKYVTGKLKSRE
jgi:predicted DNA binding CopG/RHH family protein